MAGDLSITALYTSHTWLWAGLSHAELFANHQAKKVFRATNSVMALVGLLRRDLPSLPHSLVQRHLMIDYLLHEFAFCQVIEIAAGLSRRGAAFSADPAWSYTEVDLPQVIARKRELLARTTAGQELLDRPNWRTLTGNAQTFDFDAVVDRERPLGLIAEGLFMYFDAQTRFELWRALANVLRTVPRGVLIFDLVPPAEEPPPGVVGNWLSRIMRTFTGGSTFVRDNTTRDQIVSDLREAGFATIEMYEPHTVSPEWNLPFVGERRTQQVVFSCQI